MNGYTDPLIPLVGKVDGCNTEIIKVRVLLAESFTTRIEGVTGERVDFEKQLHEIKTKRDAEMAAQAEEERRIAEAQAKKDAIEAAEQAKKEAAEAVRRNRLAAEQKKKARLGNLWVTGGLSAGVE